MRNNQGWVSVPVLLMVVMLSAVLVHHQLSLNDSRLWQTQRVQLHTQEVWQDIHQLLATLPASEGEQPHCSGFCRPQDGHWQVQQLASGNIWLQKQRIERLKVERWCATKDQQRVRCWWRHDTGEQTAIWLQY